MENKVETIQVQIKDFYGDECLADSFNRKRQTGRKPEGEVHIYDVTENGEKKLLHKSNLVVYLGREVLAQSFLRSANGLGGTDYKDEFLTWFGLGSGGVLPADPLNPIPPNNQNTELESNVMINVADASCADYHITDVDPGYSTTGFYKHPFDQVDYETDPDNDDSYIIAKISISIGVDDANGSQISEAGLFTGASSAGGWPGPFHLFSRVTFPALVKTADRRLVFIWYLYF